VFALLGLVSTDLDLSAFVNYNSAPWQIFLQTARHILSKNTSTLAILSLAGTANDRALGDLPSWVPDWSHLPTRQTPPASYTSNSIRCVRAVTTATQPKLPRFQRRSIHPNTNRTSRRIPPIIETIHLENVFANSRHTYRLAEIHVSALLSVSCLPGPLHHPRTGSLSHTPTTTPQ
jgi:hypothetical protein